MLYVLKVVAGAPLGPLTLDQVIMILLARGCDTALYRAPQVLEVLSDPNFRPDLAAYAGQTRYPDTRLVKHLDTFETLNGCLMHVLQAFYLEVVMHIVGSARTEEEANSAEFALALVPVDEAACDTSFLTLTNRVAGGYEKYFMRHCGRKQVREGPKRALTLTLTGDPSLFSRGAGDFGGPKNKKRQSLGPSIIISRGLPAIKGAASRWRRITEEEEEEEEPSESPLVRWVVVRSQQRSRICRCSRWTWTWMMRRRST